VDCSCGNTRCVAGAAPAIVAGVARIRDSSAEAQRAWAEAISGFWLALFQLIASLMQAMCCSIVADAVCILEDLPR